MPEIFRKAGYDTFATGKQHNGKKAFARSFTHGGKIFFGGMSEHYKVPVRDFDPSGEYPNEKTYSDEGTHSSELFADTAVDFLDRRDGDKPFFMYVAFTAPHDPRDMPKQYLDMYDPDSLPIPKNFLPEHPFDNGELKVRDEALAPWPRTHEIVRKHLAAYYAMITHVDAQIGRILAKLRETGEEENTIIVFAGDNGLAVGRHGLFGKQNLYEHSVHVPLIFAGPGLPEGERRHALCYLNDIFPTLCDMAGLTIPGTVESESLVPVITREQHNVRDAVFFAYKNFQRGVRSGRWKLIEYNVNGVRTTQLFDLLNDPWETANLSGNAEYSRYAAEMSEFMRGWIRKSGDAVDLDKPDWGVPVIPAWGTGA